jgi:hypothetical protein
MFMFKLEENLRIFSFFIIILNFSNYSILLFFKVYKINFLKKR